MRKKILLALGAAALVHLPPLPVATASPPTEAGCSLTTAQTASDPRGYSWRGTVDARYVGDVTTAQSRVTCWIQYHTSTWNGPNDANVALGTVVTCSGGAAAACRWDLSYRAPRAHNHFFCGQYEWTDTAGTHFEAIDNDPNVPGAQCQVVTPGPGYASSETTTAYRGGSSQPSPNQPPRPDPVPRLPSVGVSQAFCDYTAQRDTSDPQGETWVAQTTSSFVGTPDVSSWEVTCWLQTDPSPGASEIANSRHTCVGTVPAGSCWNPFFFHLSSGATVYQCQHFSWTDSGGSHDVLVDYDPSIAGTQCRLVLPAGHRSVGVVPGSTTGGGDPGGGGPGGGSGGTGGGSGGIGGGGSPRGLIVDTGPVTGEVRDVVVGRPASCEYDAVKDPFDAQGQTWMAHERLTFASANATQYEVTCWLQTAADLGTQEIANTRTTCTGTGPAGRCEQVVVFELDRSQSLYMCLHVNWTEQATGDVVEHALRDVFSTGGITTMGGTADLVATVQLAVANAIATILDPASTERDVSVDYDPNTPGTQCKLAANV